MKKSIEKILIYLSLIVIAACANNTKLPATKVTYQVKSNEQLAGYANNVSRGFTKSSGRGLSYATDNATNPYYGGWVIRDHMETEVRDCEQYASQFQSCADSDKMISVLAQCLNQVMNYRNPIMTNSYNQLDNQGQQYWAYLLNWRRASTLNNFSSYDFNILSRYAGTGYLTQSY